MNKMKFQAWALLCSYILLNTNTLTAQEINAIENAIVIVQPIYKGINTLTHQEDEKPKTTEGFLIFKEIDGIKKYYLITVNHVLLFFAENEKELGLKCTDPEMRPYKIDVYGEQQALILSIEKDRIKECLKVSSKESAKEKADVAVMDITDIVRGDTTFNFITYSSLATKDIFDSINLGLDKGHNHIGYYSYMNKNRLSTKPIYKEGLLLSTLGQRHILPDQRYFQGFKVRFDNEIDRGDCGAPIIFNYNGKPYIIGVINTTRPIHPDITQDSSVIIDTIKQFE